MIVNAPTGLYAATGQIPTLPEESGNISFTVSSESPIRSSERITQLPTFEQSRKRTGVRTGLQYRSTSAVGDLLFTDTIANRFDPGSNRKTFNIGESLAFDTETNNQNLTTPAPQLLNLRFNTNVLDLADLGLTEEEIQSVFEDAAIANEQLLEDYLLLRSQIEDIKTQIKENQKRLNETNKAIRAISELVSIDPSNEDIVVRLTTKRDEIIAANQQLTNDLIQSNEQSEDLLQQIINLVEFVRD